MMASFRVRFPDPERTTVVHGNRAYSRSRKLSLLYRSSGLRKYEITRHLPVLIFTLTAMQTGRFTVLPSIGTVVRASLMRVESCETRGRLAEMVHA